jgi:hypothetical protein
MPNFSGIWSAAQQFQARGQNIWPAPPGAPTIGTATAGLSLCASVAFTAPACTGRYPSGVTSYTVTSTPGCLTGTGAASPVTVSGLTNGTSYTFKVKATGANGTGPCSAASNSITAVNAGSQTYATPGSYSWVAPAGITSVSVVAVGGGGSGVSSGGANRAGGGGGLGYKNNYAVTPGNSYTVLVGAGGAMAFGCGYSGGCSLFINVSTVVGGGGQANTGTGGTYVGDGGGNGGLGGAQPGGYGSGGGGAGGYAGSGGAGGRGGSPGSQEAGANGSGGGGGGGGGAGSGGYGGSGGGVGLLGQGSNGTGGASASGSTASGGGGGGGSGGNNGGLGTANAKGGAYGGGGSNADYPGFRVGSGGGDGAVRIVWPGTIRQFPSTNVGNP